MSTLKGPRIELKSLEPTWENAAMLSRLIQKNAEHLRQGMPFLPAITDTVEKTLDVLHNYQYLRKEKRGNFYHIFVKNEMIGEIYTSTGCYSGGFELNYWLVKSAENQGYMKEALVLVESEHFKKHKIQLIAETLPSAARSRELLNKMGYACQGRIYYKTKRMYLEQQAPQCIQPASKRISSQLSLGHGMENVYP